jgi:hypothetical protein
MASEPSLTDADLEAIQQRLDPAGRAPWVASVEGREHTSGDSFIAGARQDIPRLIAEIKRLLNETNRRSPCAVGSWACATANSQ